jgi:hypothetical protein
MLFTVFDARSVSPAFSPLHVLGADLVQTFIAERLRELHAQHRLFRGDSS